MRIYDILVGLCFLLIAASVLFINARVYWLAGVFAIASVPLAYLVFTVRRDE